MKGYRTLMFSALMAAVGMLGLKISPEVAQHWGDMFLAAWGMGAILLRQVTNTPVGVAAVQAAIGEVASPAEIASIRNGIAELLDHAKLAPMTAQMVMSMAQRLDALATILLPAPAAGPLPVDNGAGPAIAPAPAPAAPTTAPAVASDPAPAPSAAAAPSPAVVRVDVLGTVS